MVRWRCRVQRFRGGGCLVSESECDFEALQAELAFQGDSIDKLNRALADQQQDLLLLREQLTLVTQQLRDLRNAAPGQGEPASERPPHY